MPDSSCSLIIIDPPLGEGHHGASSSAWDSEDKALTSYDLDSCLRLLHGRKTMASYTVVVYANHKVLNQFWDVLHKQGFRDIHVFDVFRSGHDGDVTSRSIVLVGTHREKGSCADDSRRGSTKSRRESYLNFYVPDGVSPNSREDINGRLLWKEAGNRERCVDEFRHIVRAYSEPNTWVLGFYSGIGTLMVAALLEGRNVAGLEPCPQLIHAASWRLSIFQKTEECINKRSQASSSQEVEDTQQGALIAEDIEQVLAGHPFSPSGEDMVKFTAHVQLTMQGLSAQLGAMSKENESRLLNDIRTSYNTHQVIQDVIRTQAGKVAFYSWLAGKWKPECDTDGHDAEKLPTC